jgi:hypothetical protein
MKKFIAIALMAAMVLSLASCGSSSTTSDSTSSTASFESSTAASETSAESEAGETASSGEVKVGYYVVPSLDASEDEASFAATYAAVTVDGDGRIVACQIDATGFDAELEDGALNEVDLRSKQEKGDDYGMVAYGASDKEWYQQADAFAAYCIGKTADEVRAIALEDGKPTDADLSAGCTIAVSSFIEAVAAAAENASVTVSASDKLGIALTTADGSDEEEAAYDTDFCVVTVDASGVVTSCQIDVAQGSIEIEDGVFAADGGKYNSKKQLGDDYGMVAYGASDKEWYQQAEAFESYVTGKNADEVAATELEDGKAADADLSAGCTISISSILANTEKAISAAK